MRSGRLRYRTHTLTDCIFSISMPIGSYHPALRWALESLKCQDVPLRVAVLDASGDARVEALLDVYANLITHRRAGPDAGQAAAIQEGWDALGGDILGWLNVDDFLYPGTLCAAARRFESDPRADVVTGQSIFLDEDGGFFGFHPGVALPDERLLRSNPISQPSTFVRRQAVEEIGGLDVSLHYTMDWDLWSRLLRNGAKFAQEADCLSGVRIERGTKTMGLGRRRRGEVMRLIAPNAGLVRRAKVMTGFGLQYFDDMTGIVSRALDYFGSRRELPPITSGRTPVIAQRSVRMTAFLPVVHYGTDPMRGLMISCEGADFEVALTLRGDMKVRASGRNGEANLQMELAAGVIANIFLTPCEGGAVRLKSASWLK